MRNKLLNQEQLEQLSFDFIKDFCKRNQIDFKPSEERIIASTKKCCEVQTLQMNPTGNFQAIIKNFQVSFETYNSKNGLHHARVQFYYNHQQLSQNGYSLRLTIITKPSLKEGKIEYVGFTEDDILVTYINHIHENQKS